MKKSESDIMSWLCYGGFLLSHVINYIERSIPQGMQGNTHMDSITMINGLTLLIK